MSASASFLLLLIVAGVASAQQLVYDGVSKSNPTPGTNVVVYFKTQNLVMAVGDLVFKLNNPSIVVGYSANYNPHDTPPEWACTATDCRTYYGNSIPPVRFGVTITVPPEAVSTSYTVAATLSSYYQYGKAGEYLKEKRTASGAFTTGEAEVALTPSIEVHQSRYVAGQAASFDVSITNSGPSAALSSTCDITSSEGDFGVAPDVCVAQGSDTWRCTATETVSPDIPRINVNICWDMIGVIVEGFGIAPSPDFRGVMTLQVTNCTAQGTLVSIPPDIAHSFNVSAVWDLSHSFAEDTARSIQLDEVSEISTLIHNDGPSSSLGSICTWYFSTAALSFHSNSEEAGDCEASYEPNLVVSCLLDAAPGDTIPRISITTTKELAGNPSFEVAFSCRDEDGKLVGKEQQLQMKVIEELDDVNVTVRVVNWNLNDADSSSNDDDTSSSASPYDSDSSWYEEEISVRKRGQTYASPLSQKDDMGTTDDGEIIFDTALAFLMEANSEGALYARNITCNLFLEGSDAPLVTLMSGESDCRDLGLDEAGRLPSRTIECWFEAMTAEAASERRTVLSFDSRVKVLNVSVECSSGYPETIENPVYQHLYRFIHVDSVDDGDSGSTAQRGDDDDDFAEKWMWIIIGGGGGLLLLLFIVPFILYILIRKRKAALMRKRRNLEDLESVDEDMEMYATPIDFGPSKRRGEARSGFEWEIPFSELEFIEKIGKGGFGLVWRGKWRETTVAIKMFNSIMNSPALKEAFRAEMDIMNAFFLQPRNLRPHTNVVQLFGVCTEDGQPWCLITEYLSNGDLRNYIRNNPPSNATIMRMAIQVATGMHHLHSEGIIHRDLAARNILLTPDLTVKVGDFGLSSVVNGAVAEKKVPVRWTAPEALSGGHVTEKADVWSYGVLLWELANKGEQPYAGMNNPEVVEAVLNEETLSLPSTAPAVLHELLADCFQMDASKRPFFKDIIKRLQTSA
ncbi:Mitogen-activated protein kinase kinase kinase 7 [Balamuthia mandrillaris]